MPQRMRGTSFDAYHRYIAIYFILGYEKGLNLLYWETYIATGGSKYFEVIRVAYLLSSLCKPSIERGSQESK